MFKKLRRIFNSEDKKPVLLSFILQRSYCSRMLGEFAENHLAECNKLIIVWKNGADDIGVKISDSLNNDEGARMLLKAATAVANGDG